MTKSIILIVSLFLTAGLLSGCPAVQMLPVIGASYEGYVVWKRGQSTRYYAYDLDRTYQAVKLSCEQLKLKAEIQNLGSGKGYFLQTWGDHRMEIDVLPFEKGLTSVVINIGVFGDKEYVEFFYRIVDGNIAAKAADDKEKPVPGK